MTCVNRLSSFQMNRSIQKNKFHLQFSLALTISQALLYPSAAILNEKLRNTCSPKRNTRFSIRISAFLGHPQLLTFSQMHKPYSLRGKGYCTLFKTFNCIPIIIIPVLQRLINILEAVVGVRKWVLFVCV